MVAKVESQYTVDKETVSKVISTTYGFCSNCHTRVRASQYGIDEECPKCEAWLDWSRESEEI